MPIGFHFQKVVRIKDRRKLKEFIPEIFSKEKKEMGSIDFVFCSNPYLLKINRDFLDHDYFTDIISFDMSNVGDNSVSGEIYISIDMVRINAQKFDVSFSKELTRVIFHGILHLCGYKDKSVAQKQLMEKKEDYYLNMFHGEH